MFLNFNTKKRTVDLHAAMWEISGIVYPHFYAGNENAPPALTGEGAGNGMTEAMPFLQNAILPSYTPTIPVGVLLISGCVTKRLSWEIKAEAET